MTGKGYVMLPCFTVEINGFDCQLTCDSLLSMVFEIFFAPFWSGAVHITEW